MLDIITDPFLDPKNIQSNTPSNSVIRFFFGWKNRNSNLMLEVCQKTWVGKPQAKEKLEMWFGDIFLVGMKIAQIKKISDVCYDVTCRVGFKHRKHSKAFVTLVTARVICEEKPYCPSVNGKWGVNPLSLLKALGVVKRIFINPEEM